jgi:hypothetical protein
VTNVRSSADAEALLHLAITTLCALHLRPRTALMTVADDHFEPFYQPAGRASAPLCCRPTTISGLDATVSVHHSDQGSQGYTSLAFGRRLREAGLVASIGSVGDCFDNAVTESFFATLECELLDRTRFATRTQARTAVFDYLEGLFGQPSTPPLHPGLPQPRRVRTEAYDRLSCCLTCQPRGVYRTDSAGEFTLCLV